MTEELTAYAPEKFNVKLMGITSCRVDQGQVHAQYIYI